MYTITVYTSMNIISMRGMYKGSVDMYFSRIGQKSGPKRPTALRNQ